MVTRMFCCFITVEFQTKKKLVQTWRPWMPKPVVLELDRRRRGHRESLRRQPKRVEVTRRITTELHRLSWQILYGKTGRVKFNRNIIVTCKLTNGNKVFNQ